MANMGHEIVLNHIRTAIRSFLIRAGVSICAGSFILILCAWIFGTRKIFTHLFGYWLYLLAFKIKKTIPFVKFNEKDIHNLVLNYAGFMRDYGVWKWSILSGCIGFVLCFCFVSYLFIKKGKRSGLEEVMRGNQLLSASDHNRVMKTEYGTQAPFEMGTPLKLGKSRILVPESLQYLHFAFIGTSGCGKSTAIEDIISQVKNRKEKALIVDLNGSFYAKFGRQSDHILSLRDKRTRPWDFWSEMDGVQAENLASAMIEEAGGDNQFFWKGSRAVLASLIKHSNNNHELWEDFKKNTSEIRKKLQNSNEISHRIIGSGDNEQADGILGNTVLDFPFLKELNQWNNPNEEKFSILNWINNHNDTSWVYLIVSDKDIEISKPLLRVWFDLACLGCLNRNPNNSDNLHTWLIIDELKSVGQLPSLPMILDKGRKYKATAVVGFQAISQIQKIYGDRDAQSILQGLQNQFFYRMNDDVSAQYASNVLGEHELEQVNMGVNLGNGTHKNRGSLNTTTTKRRVVLPDELKSLKFLQCFVKLGSHLPFKMEFEIQNQKLINLPAQSETNPNYVVGKENEEFKKILDIKADHILNPACMVQNSEMPIMPWENSEMNK